MVIMPAYNEQASVAGSIADVRTHAPFADLVVVDDGSVDATTQTAIDAGAAVLTLPFNLGVGGAMRAGFVYARRHGYQAVVQVDADGQHDASFIPHLLRGLDSADVVVGSRFAGGAEYKVSGVRRFAMRALARVLSMMTGQPLTDVTSGFRAAGPRAIRLFAAELPAEYLGDTVEAIVLCKKAGLTVTEVPVLMRQRVAGTASQGSAGAAFNLGRAGLVILLAVVRPRPAIVGDKQ